MGGVKLETWSLGGWGKGVENADLSPVKPDLVQVFVADNVNGGLKS